MQTYRLPELPYDYGALEPHIAGRIMELHHDKHHAAYVDKANAMLEKIEEARSSQRFDTIGDLERKLAFNLSGHVLHSIFWNNLSPHGGGRPSGDLAAAIDQDLGGFDEFRQQMIHTAVTTRGSGWAALLWEPLGGRIVVAQIHDHQSQTMQAAVPLMVLDAWEHAYYLQYENRKKEFFEAIWNVWSWDDIGARLQSARARDAGIAAGT